MKRVVAGLVTFAVVGLLLWSGLRRPTEEPGSPENAAAAPRPGHEAEARISALLDNTARGDVAAYLASFGGPLRERFEREVTERGRDAFASDLRRAAEARKSHAVFAAEPEGDSVARIIVETVYPDRNERQTYRLERAPDGWRVTGVETVRAHQPKAKYGSRANYQEPEGVPVQGALTVETGADRPNSPEAEP